MTSFHLGPAHGHTLMLKRAPKFLRVTEASGTFDALDQLEDRPQANEKLHAYILTGEPGRVHLSCRGRKGSGWFVFAAYHYLAQQPSDADMRDEESWQAWCVEAARKSSASKEKEIAR